MIKSSYNDFLEGLLCLSSGLALAFFSNSYYLPLWPFQLHLDKETADNAAVVWLVSSTTWSAHVHFCLLSTHPRSQLTAMQACHHVHKMLILSQSLSISL